MPAYESVWKIADEFGYQSFEDHFMKRNEQNSDQLGYLKENFNVKGYLNGKYISSNPNLVSRLSNALISAINGKDDALIATLLPKYIVVVPDDNMIKFLNHYNSGMSRALGKLIDRVMSDHEKAVNTYKDMLPFKAKKSDFPVFVWILAPTHDNFANNFERHKFNKCVENMAKFHERTFALHLKKVWDCTDTKLYIKESRRFTVLGYTVYWQAIDKTMKYCDTIKMKKGTNYGKKEDFKKKFQGNFNQRSSNQDRYRWRRQHSSAATAQNKQWNKPAKPVCDSDDDEDFQTNGTDRRRLPTPPPI